MKRIRFYLLLISCSILCSACWKVPEQRAISNPTKAQIDRGEDLVLGLGACGFCHGLSTSPKSPLAGGRIFSDRYGKLSAANVTASKSGIGAWSLADFIKAIREDRGPEAEYLSAEFHQGAKWMADNDLASIFSYLRSLQPVKNELERRELEFWDRNTIGFTESRYKVTGYVPQLKVKDEIRYGQYLVDNVADCGRCHNSPAGVFSSAAYLAGGMDIIIEDQETKAPSLLEDSESGLGSWSETDLIAYLQTAERPDGTKVNAKLCPVEYYSLAREEDLKAIAAYLKSLG